MARGRVHFVTSTPLGGGASVLSNVLQLNERAVAGDERLDFAAVLGYAIADVAGTFELWQGFVEADVNGAAPVANATFVTQVAVPAGGNGTQIAIPIVAPLGRIRYTNGVGAQATFRLIVRSVE
jgi:hypothetical protein